MALPTGTALTVTMITVNSSGALYDPTPLPTVVYASKPDGTAVTPVALAHPAVGKFTATVFSTADNNAEGTYKMGAYTSDVTDKRGGLYEFEWDVDNTLAGILADTATLGAATFTFNSPRLDMDTGEPLYTRRSYKEAYGNSLRFTVTNLILSLLTVGVTTSLRIKVAGVWLAFAGVADSATTGYIEIDNNDTTAWVSGDYDTQFVVLKDGDPIHILAGILPVREGGGA